VNPRLVEVL